MTRLGCMIGAVTLVEGRDGSPIPLPSLPSPVGTSHPPTALWVPFSKLSPWSPWFSLILAGDQEHFLGSKAQWNHPEGPP